MITFLQCVFRFIIYEKNQRTWDKEINANSIKSHTIRNIGKRFKYASNTRRIDNHRSSSQVQYSILVGVRGDSRHTMGRSTMHPIEQWRIDLPGRQSRSVASARTEFYTVYISSMQESPKVPRRDALSERTSPTAGPVSQSNRATDFQQEVRRKKKERERGEVRRGDRRLAQ